MYSNVKCNRLEEQTYVFIIVHLHDVQVLLMGFVSRNLLVYIFNGIGVEVRRGRVSKDLNAPAAQRYDTAGPRPRASLHASPEDGLDR